MQLGATVASATSDAVTHVVAGSNETDKAHWARRQGRHLVSPGWLHAAGILSTSLSLMTGVSRRLHAASTLARFWLLQVLTSKVADT